MISIVTYGRNDNYGFNLAKRTALGFNCLAEVLTEEDEILFVDYNSPEHLPTLPEFIWDTLTDKALNLIRVIRIPRDLHERLKDDSPLPMLENVSRNAAIVRSNPQNHWILSTNPDVLLVLCSHWQNLDELLRSVSDSFYEMPRFDIPESIWSSLYRGDPKTNMRALRDWLVSNKAAVVETVPDWHFQKYMLFDAPGDFQLAPREYFFRLRGFDESMNKYLHSDSNLAKRMWLLNGGRTDHLLGHLWVLHQDHYLTGEWAKNFGTIVHNDLSQKVLHQEKIEANGENWGLHGVPLPIFKLSEQITKERVSFSQSAASVNGDLPLSRALDWRTQSLHRLYHYHPEVLSLYLRENLRVVRPESLLVYVGQSPATLESVRHIWEEVSPSGVPVQDLSNIAERGESVAPDVLLVDFYYERTEYWERRIRLIHEKVQRRVAKGQITEYEAGAEISHFINSTDFREWEGHTVSLWQKVLPHLRLRPGVSIILAGCSQYVGLYSKFKEVFSACYVGPKASPKKQKRLHSFYQRLKGRKAAPALTCCENLMGSAYFDHADHSRRRRTSTSPIDTQTLYVHHRLVVLRVN